MLASFSGSESAILCRGCMTTSGLRGRRGAVLTYRPRSTDAFAARGASMTTPRRLIFLEFSHTSGIRTATSSRSVNCVYFHIFRILPPKFWGPKTRKWPFQQFVRHTRYYDGTVRCTCRYGGLTAVDGGTDSQLSWCSKHTAVADQTVCKYDRSLPRYTFSLTGYPEIAHIYRPQIALKSPKNLTDSHFSWEKLQISFFWRFRAKSRLWLSATVFITITTYRRNVWNWHFL